MRPQAGSTGDLYISAPGKIILFGEHAVVYGKNALAGSIDLRSYVHVTASTDGRIHLSLPDLQVEKAWKLGDLLRAGEELALDHPVDHDRPPSLEKVVPYARKLCECDEEQHGAGKLAVLAFWYLLLGAVEARSVRDKKRELVANGEAQAQSTLEDLFSIKLSVRFTLPSCVGLGSSGAFCVSIGTAILQSAGLISSPSVPVDGEGTLTWHASHLDMIRKWAAAAESLIHGRASGLDATICTYGGVSSFEPGRSIRHLKNPPTLRVLLVNSKVERSTGRMVAQVKERREKFPGVIEGIFNAIDEISKEATRILDDKVVENGQATTLPNGGDTTSVSRRLCSDEEHQSLQDLCRINNQLLVALGVGHAKIDQISTLLARYGIYTKVTGAGGGGCVFAFLKPDTSVTALSMIEKELKKLDCEVWQPPLGGPGIVCHTKIPEVFQ